MRRLLGADRDPGLSRRSFLRASATAAGGLLVSMYVDLPALAQEGSQPPPAGTQPPAQAYPPDAFVHISPDGRIVITVNRVELGQGVSTALPMILADEMDADWSRVAAEIAPAGDVYKDPVIGVQMVGGSSSIANSYQQYRELGAKTRAMLVAVAAARWQVTAGQCRTANSVVYGPGNRRAGYAELASDAARQPVPDKVRLKEPSEFRLIGKRVRRLDGRAKCDGSQKFGLDLELPGMKIAVIARPPVFGGRVRGFDDKDARSVEGVDEVFEIPLVHGTAVAVVAGRFWAAKQARDRLKVDWDLSGIEHADSSELHGRFQGLARTAGRVAVNRGDEKAIDGIAAGNRIEAEYAFPYLAHTPMEPLNITVRFDGDRAEAWTTSQLPTYERRAMAEVLELQADQVTFHIGFAGGAFGRRGTLDGHLQREAAAIAKRVRGTPVKLVWTREDDVQSGYYRPLCAHRVDVGIGGDGMPAAWRHVVVGQSFLIGTGNPFESVLVKDGMDFLVVEGSADSRYAIPNFHVSAHHPKVNVPVHSLRSVGYTHNTFVMETLIDELATRAKVDPITYRLRLLNADAKRLRAALTLLQEKSAGWRHGLPPRRAAGIACSEYHGTAVACAADVSIAGNRPRIHRVTVALDCGLAVNPLTIENQFQGGLVFGLTQLMANGAITLKDGRVEQRNFDGYTPPYIADAPVAIDVHIVPSAETPTGVGEGPVPVIAPAVVNALARLTGKRYRTLPLVTI
jgi:isoquinoline 1-oxidoreductase beta subunit